MKITSTEKRKISKEEKECGCHKKRLEDCDCYITEDGCTCGGCGGNNTCKADLLFYVCKKNCEHEQCKEVKLESQPSPKIGWEERFDEEYKYLLKNQSRFDESEFEHMKSFISQLLEEEYDKAFWDLQKRFALVPFAKEVQKDLRSDLIKRVEKIRDDQDADWYTLDEVLDILKE